MRTGNLLEIKCTKKQNKTKQIYCISGRKKNYEDQWDIIPNLRQVSWWCYRHSDRRLEIDPPHNHIFLFESLPDMTSCKTEKKKYWRGINAKNDHKQCNIEVGYVHDSLCFNSVTFKAVVCKVKKKSVDVGIISEVQHPLVKLWLP